MGFFKSLFDDNAKDIKRYSKIVEKINAYGPAMHDLTDAELTGKTAEFRARLANGETEDDLLPEAFAVVREAGERVLSMRHFDVQLIGGLALSEGRIAEMRTGEGKTLVATAPAYLHALSGKGVHIVTVNDYLARRDSEWMGRIFRFLGLSVGLVVHGMEADEKRRAYNADITYGTNNEFGFDYLRDNMSFSKEHLVQRPLHYAIVDEVDSILIDEARTPLIISGPSGKSSVVYYQAAQVVSRLKEEEDYTVDIKLRVVTLTEAGVAKVEKALGVDNLYEAKHTELAHHINQALRAKVLFRRDRDYVVKDGQVIIVDEFTGRLMFGRRYNEGLHQAIEAKEKVKIERESQTLASITFQNYFRMYERLSGMTGTARTEENEFRQIYGLDVVEIPTNKPVARVDHSDVIYRSVPGKYKAVVEEIAQMHASGRPVLVGTISIERSEELSAMLTRRGIKHQVLNAKYHEKESEIIAQAGRLGAVTIATNMAGRGTDIVLGGNGEALAQHEILSHPEREYTDEERKALVAAHVAETKAEHDKVVALGGLHIIGTERHDSRRIDNQLRGRAGRQGDPGSTRFFLSMEDDLVKRFGGNIAGMMDKFGMDDSVPIDSGIITKTIEQAQKRVEERHFDARKNVLEYDDVMNRQREIVYKERREALMEDDLSANVKQMFASVIGRIVDYHAVVSDHVEEWDLEQLRKELLVYCPLELPTEEELKQLAPDQVAPLITERTLRFYALREEKMGSEKLRIIEKQAILQTVNAKWMDHLDAMDQMRQGIGLQAIGNENPLFQYQKEALEMFNALMDDIQATVCRICLYADLIEQMEERTDLVTNRDENGAVKRTPVKKEQTVGRNDYCPCGSGKKYKKCCGANK
ncbi:MAG: preprotein translocase subunit SecA [Firmicutes bacterium]|nr:preprotein translocase subunit SecA [Bacillota bacterium]